MNEYDIKVYQSKINKIRKYFKKDKLYLELILLNYFNYNMYIAIYYNNEHKSYKLSWFDLDKLVIKDINKYISYEYIPDYIISGFNKTLDNHDLTNITGDNPNNKIIFNITNKGKIIKLEFNNYLPIRYNHLASIIITLFDYLPSMLKVFLNVLMAEYTGESYKYDYKMEFDFDLFNDDLNSIFFNKIIKRGEDYYSNDKVIYLEKIDDRYFAVVEGSENYLIIIKYIEENKKLRVYCSCPCEFYCKHIYAVILAIRDNLVKRFYKVYYNYPKKNLLEVAMNKNYKLCLGIVEQNLSIVSDDGDIELVPIVDENNECQWKVLEDTEDERLTKEIMSFMSKL